MVCSYCHQDGHYRPTCPLKKAHQQQQQPQEPEEPEPIEPIEPIPRRIQRIPRPRSRRPTDPPPNGSDPEPLPIQWPEAIRTAFIRDVQSDPITTNWPALAHKYQRTPESLKETYRRLVPPIEHIDLVASLLNTSALDAILQRHTHICTACHTEQYSPLQYWQSDGFCEACHARMFEEEIAKRWRQVRQYAEETGKAECEFCRKRVIFREEMMASFHFDHRDMFEKSDSIANMIRTGQPLFEILREVDLCQTLCVSCHTIVTEIERISGFHRAKNNMTRQRKKNIQTMPSLEEMREKYEEHMTPIYEALKKRLGPKSQ